MSSNDMKMLVAIVRDSDLDEILNALLEENFRVTRIASSGGFFRRQRRRSKGSGSTG